MSEFVLFTESTADLSAEMVAEMGINVLPMEFTLDGKAYTNYPDNRELAPADFYNTLRKGGMCTTNAVNTAAMLDAFGPVMVGGKDVLYIAFSSGMSSTCQNALIAAEQLKELYPGRTLYVVDSLNATLGEGAVAWEAARLRDEGRSAAEIADILNKNIQSFNTWFTVNDLMFLRRGGRLSGGVAIAGTLLGIKPVLHVDEEGHLINMEKVRSRKGSLDSLAQHYIDHGIDKADHPVFISHADSREDLDYLADKCRAAGAKKVYIGDVGPVIGAHSGPGTIALSFWGDGR